MTLRKQYLRAYDEQLRTDAETPAALRMTRLGQLRLSTFAGGLGFVSYRDLSNTVSQGMSSLVTGAIEYFGTDPEISKILWKVRQHDMTPGLIEALLQQGFSPGAQESIMVGQLEGLCTNVPEPEDVTLRKVTSEEDVRAACAMADEAFGEPTDLRTADAMLERLARKDGMELWVAETDGKIVGCGRLEPVPDSDFAGFWGGAMLSPYRGRGIYRALTAARAQSAIAQGKTLAHSESSEFSRPILERSGLLKISTTTSYWRP
ncbi:GNAT family N-acetyltransferase [Arthrobacter sp. MYb227]|uniref:GNAT family N-acetyltransferase n=1 Tax=Arthrobacter sp. MYb227 TaxID=1848601 RepID=UPI000CFCA68A|nr:GNAT family N-acetyltransferase [Arthrobacter sp. MYb227]PQZ96340.1 GNAT family N-acetyltransferase [Arthrobacter sp. MYb227]